MERVLRRLLKRHGPYAVLEMLAYIMKHNADEAVRRGKRMAKRTRRDEWREAGFNAAAKYRYWERGLRQVIGGTRYLDATDDPVCGEYGVTNWGPSE